ncbi:hypothetical protein SSAG_00985 [Streptomyces sp. Mg1]|nr:hypothetical protein SSAG_00985 [Streptomyces sp. Mg1]
MLAGVDQVGVRERPAAGHRAVLVQVEDLPVPVGISQLRLGDACEAVAALDGVRRAGIGADPVHIRSLRSDVAGAGVCGKVEDPSGLDGPIGVEAHAISHGVALVEGSDVFPASAVAQACLGDGPQALGRLGVPHGVRRRGLLRVGGRGQTGGTGAGNGGRGCGGGVGGGLGGGRGRGEGGPGGQGEEDGADQGGGGTLSDQAADLRGGSAA